MLVPSLHRESTNSLMCIENNMYNDIYSRESVDSHIGMALIGPLSLNKCSSSELLNAAPLSPFRNITWPTSVSRHDNTLKGGKYTATMIYGKLLKPQFFHLLLLHLLQNQ